MKLAKGRKGERAKGRKGACVYEDAYYRPFDQKIDQPDKASEPCFEQGNPLNEMTEACAKAVPCEVTRLLAMHEGGIRRERQPKFPQTSTWDTTGNSSGTLFASYRDLGRHYVKSAGYLIRAAMSNTPEDFDHALEAQAAAPYVRAVFAR